MQLVRGDVHRKTGHTGGHGIMKSAATKLLENAETATKVVGAILAATEIIDPFAWVERGMAIDRQRSHMQFNRQYPHIYGRY